MQDLVRYRAMESLCRQRAVFHPLESWRLLAEAEMWHHKALEETEFLSFACNGPAKDVPVRARIVPNSSGGGLVSAI